MAIKAINTLSRSNFLMHNFKSNKIEKAESNQNQKSEKTNKINYTPFLLTTFTGALIGSGIYCDTIDKQTLKENEKAMQQKIIKVDTIKIKDLKIDNDFDIFINKKDGTIVAIDFFVPQSPKQK